MCIGTESPRCADESTNSIITYYLLLTKYKCGKYVVYHYATCKSNTHVELSLKTQNLEKDDAKTCAFNRNFWLYLSSVF